MPIVELKRSVHRSDYFDSAFVREELMRRVYEATDASMQALIKAILEETTLDFPIKLSIDVESRHWRSRSSIRISHNDKEVRGSIE